MPEPETTSGLFAAAVEEPLAARMRPRTLDEFVGQERIVGRGRLLRRAIEADQLSSVIFYGPPGTGKTTLARVIANTTKARFTALNAVLAGVKDIREAVAAAQRELTAGRRTILFVDEVHRFNKAQQDALLPWVENGTVILIGATTENPYFEVNKALVSRSRIFELTPLESSDLERVLEQALEDAERGYGRLEVRVAQDARDHLVNVANGDARALLNALELAVTTTPAGEDGVIEVTLEVAEESIQRRAVLYDKEGDAHFDTISAFIKSVRGSDPDASLYWLAKMVYAGEDPRFILRRLLVLASEDVGLAAPDALAVVASAAAAYDYVGMPEGRYHLAQATLYLATAPKSNSTMGFFDALAAVANERESQPPDHLKDANRDSEGLGHGAGYLYPHAYRDHWVAQQYLPSSLQGKVFYRPSSQGFEAGIAEGVARSREAQLAAMLDRELEVSREPGGKQRIDAARDRWLERTVSRSGKRLGLLRDRLFELAGVERHHLVLDLRAGSGLLTWEATRRAPDGMVVALEEDGAAVIALKEQAAALPELQRPVVVQGSLPGAAALVQEALGAGAGGATGLDVIVGRQALGKPENAGAVLREAARLLASSGRLVLAEVDVSRSQRLYRLVDLRTLPDDLSERIAAAEEAIYARGVPGSDQGLAETERLAREAGLEDVSFTRIESTFPHAVNPLAIDRWFARRSEPASYADQLSASLDDRELALMERLFRQQLANSEVPWTHASYFVTARA